MADFEDVFKIIVVVSAVVGLPAILYLGFRWALAGIRMFERETSGTGPVSELLAAEVDALRTRLADLEAGQTRLSELEERLDFAERMLAQRPEARQLSK